VATFGAAVLDRGDASSGPSAGEVATWRPEEVPARLGSRLAGLTAEEVLARRERDGPNRLAGGGRTSVVRVFATNVTHLMAVLLWVGGGLALLAELPQLAVAVWAVNLVNGIFSTWQEHRAERAVEALRDLLPLTQHVRRDGVEGAVPVDELVAGDVVLLAEGDRISADARLVEAHDLQVDQSALTGESRPVRRTEHPLPPGDRPPATLVNHVLAGTSVTSGRGIAVVTATGMRTEFGTIARLTGVQRRDPSPLQRELARTSRAVGVIAVSVGVTLFALGQLMTPMTTQRGLVFALGMVVAFVPEGLLPTVTLSLAMATQRMAGRQAVVKRLSAVEALGSTTVICTDKTGTLTCNRVAVRAVVTASSRFEPDVTDGRPDRDVLEVLRTGILVNDARLAPPGTDIVTVGDPTEGALLVAASDAGLDVEAERRRCPRIAEHAFDAQRKRMSTLHREGDELVLRCKGAPRELLERCGAVRVGAEVRPLTGEDRRRASDDNDALARDAMRVLGVAERRWPVDRPPAADEDLERELTWLGLVGTYDPPRPAVAQAVATCRHAGIRIVMITGDYGVTAESLARRIGLVRRAERVRIVNGDELDTLDVDTLAAMLADRTATVFARTTPSQKVRIVAALQQLGETVAVTGDGVNDAPALKRADIGVAMGRSGTDVAREAADLVLLDDDFASIVAAVEEGRAVYRNLRRFTGYIFTSNVPEAVPFVLFGLTGGGIPIALDVMHILAIDLGTDLLPALALGAEPPERGLMDRPPRARTDHLITARLLRRSYLVLGPVQAGVTLGMFWLAYRAQGVDAGWLELPQAGPVHAAATAAALAAVVTLQIGNLFAHRARLPDGGVRWGGGLVWGAVASELVLLAAIVYLSPLQRIVGTAAFPAWLWLVLLAVAPTLLVVDRTRARLAGHARREVRT
jgi:P-type Ca2+ transporter type 2C